MNGRMLQCTVWLARGVKALLGRTAAAPERADLIIVPGAAVWPGGRASPALERRVLMACALWEQQVAPRIAVSGGVVMNPPEEAVVGAGVARRAGVPESALLLETHATNTVGNARHVHELAPVQHVVVVTDDFHVARAGLIFAQWFAKVDVVSCRSPRRWRYAGREVIATLWFALRGAA